MKRTHLSALLGCLALSLAGCANMGDPLAQVANYQLSQPIFQLPVLPTGYTGPAIYQDPRKVHFPNPPMQILTRQKTEPAVAPVAAEIALARQMDEQANAIHY